MSAPPHQPAPADRWVALPSRRRPRFMLPAATGRQAFCGLAVYHPVTRRALVAWWMARAIARLGTFRILPAADPPDDLDAIREWYPSALVAVALSPRGTRHGGLVLDTSGRPLGFVKIARDEPGALRLRHELGLVRHLGPLLPAPVSAPVPLHDAPGILSFEAGAWRPRLRPWNLDAAVAAALGTFYRRGGGDERRGPAHGDFTPWNLLLLRDGSWLLVDWEEATSEGQPFQDPFHWLVQSHALLGRPSSSALVAGVRGAGWIGRALDAYAAAARLARVDREATFRDYLARTAAALGPAGGRHDREITARLALLEASSGRSRGGAAG